MTISIKHKFVNPKSDTADATVSRASNWNDEHDITLAQNRVLGRVSAANGPVEELTGEQIRTISDTTQAGVLVGINTRTASYTLVASDRGKIVEMNVASANTVTVPNEAGIGGVNYPIGTQIKIAQLGTGQSTLLPAAGVTLRSVTGGLSTSTRYGALILYKRASNDWFVIDQTSAFLDGRVDSLETIAGGFSNVSAVAADIANVNTVANNLTGSNTIGTVATNTANVNTVAGSIGSVNTVSGINASVTAVAAINAKVVIAADNVSDINNFADVYQGGKAADPTLRNDGTALQTGDLYFNTTNDRMRVYETGTGWIDYEATAQTAAATAATQAGTATTQASTATAQATIATTQAGLATTARTGAETARDAAFGNANVYASTAAGLAATTNGQQFQVVVGSDIVRYQNTSGTAVEVARYPNTAAINALQNSIGENVWWDNGVPEFRGRNGTTSVPNADGTFTLPSIYTDMTVNAIERFAVGKYVSLSVRLVSGTGTADLPLSRIRFFNSSGGTISTTFVSATPDEWGYYSAHNVVVPATTSYIEALADAAPGDTLEIIFSPSKFTYACRKASPTRPAIVGGNNRDLVPVKLAQVRQAAQVFPQPNGTRGTWESLVAQRGSSASSTTLAALQDLEDDLNVSGLKHKLAYLNMRCGNDSIAALTPFIDRFGYGYDQTSTTFTFVEANGMAHSLIARVYLGPAFIEMGAYGCSLGAYLLNDVANSGTVLWDFGTWILFPLLATYYGHDAWSSGGGRVLSPIGQTQTKGMLIGSRGPDGVNRIFRNGIVYGESTVVTSLGANPTNSGTINFARGASAGDFIGYGLTVDEMCALTWMIHRFNLALGRAATADGLFS